MPGSTKKTVWMSCPLRWNWPDIKVPYWLNILWRPHISETPSARCRQCGDKGFLRSCRTNLKLKTQKRKFLCKAEELGDDCGDSFHLFTTQSMIKTLMRIYTSFVCFFHVPYDIPTFSFYEYRTRTLTIFIGTIQYVPAYKSQRAMNPLYGMLSQ